MSRVAEDNWIDLVTMMDGWLVLTSHWVSEGPGIPVWWTGVHDGVRWHDDASGLAISRAAAVEEHLRVRAALYRERWRPARRAVRRG